LCERGRDDNPEATSVLTVTAGGGRLLRLSDSVNRLVLLIALPTRAVASTGERRLPGLEGIEARLLRLIRVLTLIRFEQAPAELRQSRGVAAWSAYSVFIADCTALRR